jgi:HlyD family secretion protein
VLVELANPDSELMSIEAERDVASAEAEIASLRANLEIERLRHVSELSGTRLEAREARRRAQAAEELASNHLIAQLELTRLEERAEELEARLQIEEQHSHQLGQAQEARLAAQRSQLERRRALAELRARQVSALHVRAGMSGVLQELPVDVGQRVLPGTLLARVADPSQLIAELRIPETQARLVALHQPAEVDLRSAVVTGRVVRIDPAVEKGSVTVDVRLGGELPPGARPDLSVDGRIEIGRVADALYTGRPAQARSSASLSLFRLSQDGSLAERVAVELGALSAREVEVRAGLEEGDRVILSDTSEWDGVDVLVLE